MKFKKLWTISFFFLIACNGRIEKDSIVEPISTEQKTTVLTYEAFPSGYHYLNDTTALASAVNNADIAYIRTHAWNIWAGIMQPAKGIDWPIWYTWLNTYDAFLQDASELEMTLQLKGQSLIDQNIANIMLEGPVLDTFKNSLPYYPIPSPVVNEYADSGIFNSDTSGIIPGKHFLFNGDILVPTESLSESGFDWIRNNNLYKVSKLDSLYANVDTEHSIHAPQKHIVTKHMYWPVLADEISGIPVWDESYFPPGYRKYAGYETWTNLVGIDPSGKDVGKTVSVSYLYDVYKKGKTDTTLISPTTAEAKVYGLDDFYYHKITQTDWDSFDAADKAILNASSYWAHNKPIGVGDYIVTIAMHINTKEIETWTMQSSWWSNTPNQGKYTANRPDLPNAKGPWDHYLLVDSYGVIDQTTGQLPIAMNPYIELAIHPIETNCNNCHNRAGWPTGSEAGKSSYQNPDSSCLAKYLLTDFQWIIPDRAK